MNMDEEAADFPAEAIDPAKPRCRDCNAPAGALHTPGCDVERCPACGWQIVSCGCASPGSPIWGSPGRRPPDQERLPWTGEFPGAADCREFGFWCRWQHAVWDAYGSWRRCEAGEPGATEDLTRLHRVALWDRAARRWRLPSPLVDPAKAPS